MNERANVERERADDEFHKAELIKMDYENLQLQVDEQVKQAAIDNKQAANDKR